MKKLKRALIVTVLVSLPATGIAFLGIGDSSDALLAKMLAELIVHTKTLRNLLTGVDYLNNVQNDIRRGVEDPIFFETLGLPNREAFLNEIANSETFRETPILDKLDSVAQIKNTVENTWGALPKSTTKLKQLATKDLQAIYSLSHAAAIQGEANSFFETGRTFLEDLENAHESKAAIRNAQASALQIQQLGQIEANQGLQISLEAQQILSDNEKQKGVQQFSESYFEMLSNGFANLKPMGMR